MPNETKTIVTNQDRLLRAIRSLQLLQRTNAPTSGIAKAAAKALVPLLAEMAKQPADAAPILPEGT